MAMRFPVVLAGAFGGSFPNVLAVAIDLTKDKPLPQFTFLLGVVLFAVLGGSVAAVFEETVLKKAFLLGVGLPSLLQVSIGNVTADGTLAGTTGAHHLLVALAHAQASPALVPGRELDITGMGGGGTFEVLFLRGEEEVEVLHRDPSAQGSSVPVPAEATHFRIEVSGSRSRVEPLPHTSDATVPIQIEVKSNPWSGFQKALGVRNVRDSSVSIVPR